AMVDLHMHVGSDLPLGVADRQVAAAQSGSLARLDARRADAGGRLVAGDRGQFEALELLALGSRQRRRRGAGLVLGDELLQVAALGENGLVRTLFVDALLALKFEIGIDLAWKGCQLAPAQVKRVRASGAEKRPIVGDDQARGAMAAQEMFQEDL